MKIAVCIKQVPDTTDVRINPETNTLIREGVASITNPFDEYAVEEALLIKEKHGGEVHVISMGPPQAVEVLKNALALGADKVYLVSDKAFAGADTLATAYTLARTINAIGGADLVICGKQAIDGDTAQVGPGVATRLGIPQLTYVTKVREIDPGEADRGGTAAGERTGSRGVFPAGRADGGEGHQCAPPPLPDGDQEGGQGSDSSPDRQGNRRG